VRPGGPPGTFFETFGDVPEAGALASARQPMCTHGRELLLESWVGRKAFVTGYCRRLGFAIHQPTDLKRQ
jgi:hypothetical protein